MCLKIVFVAAYLQLGYLCIAGNNNVEEEADENLDVRTEVDYLCVARDPFPKCFASCFRPGACDGCCKDRGYTRGKCVLLGCACCE